MSNFKVKKCSSKQKCDLCLAISKTSEKSWINAFNSNQNTNNNNSEYCKVNYVSLTALNKNCQPKYKTTKRELKETCKSSNPEDSQNSDQKSINIFTFKILSIILFHYFSILFYLVYFLKNSDSLSFSLFYLEPWQISLIFCSFILVILFLPKLRLIRPINYFIFLLYTFLICNFYLYISFHYKTILFVVSVFLISLAQAFLILFCFQSKFSLCCKPILPYLYICILLISFLTSLFIINFFIGNFFQFLLDYLKLDSASNIQVAFA